MGLYIYEKNDRWCPEIQYNKNDLVVQVELVYDCFGTWIDRMHMRLIRYKPYSLCLPLKLLSRFLDLWKLRHVIGHKEYVYKCVSSHYSQAEPPDQNHEQWEKV